MATKKKASAKKKMAASKLVAKRPTATKKVAKSKKAVAAKATEKSKTGKYIDTYQRRTLGEKRMIRDVENLKDHLHFYNPSFFAAGYLTKNPNCEVRILGKDNITPVAKIFVETRSSKIIIEDMSDRDYALNTLIDNLAEQARSGKGDFVTADEIGMFGEKCSNPQKRQAILDAPSPY